MLFFKRVMRKLGNKLLWFPQLMTVGKPADTEELAGRLSAISTVSKGDVFAVLSDLPDVMADILSNGRAVHIDGLGSFYLSCTSRGNGVETKEEVNESQIKGFQGVKGGLPARTPSRGRPENETSSRATGYGVH